MIGVKTVAALVSMVNGVYAAAVGAYWGKVVPTSSGATGGLDGLFVSVLGFILLLDSLVCLLGSSKAFYASAGISLLLVILEAAVGIQLGSSGFIGGLGLALVTVGLDVIAARTRKVISEADHPLNLPVFG
jgi:hypothetical protein